MVLIVLDIILVLLCIIFLIDRRALKSDYNALLFQRDKFQIKFEMLNCLYDHTGKVRVLMYLKKQKCRRIAIYGLNEIGNHLYWLLIQNGIEIPFCIDNGLGQIWDADVPVLSAEEKIEGVDAIIITLNKKKFPNVANDLKCSVKTFYLEDLFTE